MHDRCRHTQIFRQIVQFPLRVHISQRQAFQLFVMNLAKFRYKVGRIIAHILKCQFSNIICITAGFLHIFVSIVP